ncbi:MAG TPA: penicillin-binding protein 2 [Candidatus Methylomirabilis sp.]|nr:penicillin-binding protein 2 [Candidatus Methylomirabilis sp.]
MKSLRQNNGSNSNNNRINFLIAIVFLFGAALLGRLFYLQIIAHDFYAEKAANQQQAETVLAPERGKIYISDGSQADDTALYPLATNKQMFLLYAVPREIAGDAQKEDIANKLYFVFDQANVESKIAEDFSKIDDADLAAALTATAGLPAPAKQAKEAEIKQQYDLLHRDKTWLAARGKKIAEEEDKAKKQIISDYLVSLDRSDSSYVPLEKKVEEETLKRFYSLFPDTDGGAIDFAKLSLISGQVELDNGSGKEKEVHLPGIYQSSEYYRYYPENDVGSHLLGFVRTENGVMSGNYGLEGFFDKELAGTPGYLKTDLGAQGNLAILDNQESVKPVNGSDLVLTIDRSVQFFICQKLVEAAKLHQSDSASVIAVDPKTGAIIAACSYPDFDPNNYQQETDLSIFNNPMVFEQYEPGSVFKAITMSAAINEGKITPETTYNDKGTVIEKGWKKPIKNADFDTAGGHGIVNMTYVLEHSLNTGAIFAMQQIGAPKFAEYVKNFGFGQRTGIELESESSGNINNLLAKRINSLDADTASFGQGISVTPLQMLMSYAAIANGGLLLKPYVVKEIIGPDGAKEITKPQQVRQVISEKTANLLVGMLVSDVENGHSQKAKINGYFIAGKTGTAQVPNKNGYSDETIHTFVGMAPAGDPKFAILVKFNNPKDFQYADYTATPLFRDIADFMLKYYQVPKER